MHVHGIPQVFKLPDAGAIKCFIAAPPRLQLGLRLVEFLEHALNLIQ